VTARDGWSSGGLNPEDAGVRPPFSAARSGLNSMKASSMAVRDLFGPITSEEDLEERLSRPPAAVVSELGQLRGDLLVVGASGKMGPSLARMARRALDEAGSRQAVIGVGRFANPRVKESLARSGVRCVSCDLFDAAAVDHLPDVAAVMFMVGVKFGTTGAEALTWATNCHLAGLVARRYAGVPTVVFSTGNVYPLVVVASGGAVEETPPAPIGEYAQSALGRERVFEFFSRTFRTPVTTFRLNYAFELRYGIPVDVAWKVREGEPIDLEMGRVNVLWQGDAVAIALRSLAHASSPPLVLNVTGHETVTVRDLAERFGERLGRRPVLRGAEAPTALLSDTSRARSLFGPPEVPLAAALDWVADWVKRGGRSYRKPTRFERRDGAF
jgi:nucleoside-diphosphate-sugar epimerase